MITNLAVLEGVALVLLGLALGFARHDVTLLQARLERLKASHDEYGRAMAREAFGLAARAVELWLQSRIDRRQELAAHLRHLGELARSSDASPLLHLAASGDEDDPVAGDAA